MDIKNLVIGALAVLAVVFGVSYFKAPSTVQVPVGAISGPDISSPYLSINSVQRFYNRKGLNIATTTVCAIQSPSATSTLALGAIRFETSSTTASTVTLAKANTAYATTTVLTEMGVAANAKATLIASSTTGLANFVFSPSQWFVVGMAGTGAQTYSPVGICQASFEVI